VRHTRFVTTNKAFNVEDHIASINAAAAIERGRHTFHLGAPCLAPLPTYGSSCARDGWLQAEEEDAERWHDEVMACVSGYVDPEAETVRMAVSS